MVSHSLIFRICNIVVACFMIIGGVFTCFAGGFPNFIRGIFCILFGIMTGVFEFRLPAAAAQHVSFMFSFFGRGIFYIFIGCIMLNYYSVAIASGIIVALVGIAFCVLQFVPRVEPPSNMRKQAYDDSMQGYYNNSTANAPGGGADPYQQSGYYAQNPSNQPGQTYNQPPAQTYNVGGVV